MPQMQIEIINKLGLHARAASKLVELTTRYSSQIQLVKDGREVDAKSIMSVMMLAASKGTELTIKTSGQDEDDALSALEQLINNRFDESE